MGSQTSSGNPSLLTPEPKSPTIGQRSRNAFMDDMSFGSGVVPWIATATRSMTEQTEV